MKFSIKDFFSKCDQIRGFLRIWSHLLKKSLMENFIFCAVRLLQGTTYLKPGVYWRKYGIARSIYEACRIAVVLSLKHYGAFTRELKQK